MVALLVVLLLFRWAGEGLEAFAGLSRRLQSIGLLGDVATRSKHTVRHVVQEPPTRMRPPDVEDAVRSKAADWAECMVQFGDGSYDAEEVWVFRRKDFEEFQRLIGLRLSYRKPGHSQEGPARYGEARREEAMQGTKVICRERDFDPVLQCWQCVKVFTGGVYQDAGIAVPAHPEMQDVVQCLSLSVGEVEGTGANATPGQAVARNRSPLKQTAFCNYVNARFSSTQGFPPCLSDSFSIFRSLCPVLCGDLSAFHVHIHQRPATDLR